MAQKRHKLLAINFFPAFVPPRSGGEQRYYMLYRHLSDVFDVTLLSATYADAKVETIEHSPSFREVRVPKPREADQIHWKLDSEQIGPECSGLALALAGEFDTELGQQMGGLVAAADLIVHESPFTLPYDRGAGSDGKLRVYNAYNVEYRLAEQMFHGEIGQRGAAFIRDLEARMIACSSAVLAISEEERSEFADTFGFARERIFLAPNGFEPEARPDPAPRRERSALFLGSAHPPNINALEYIAKDLAPALSDVTFYVLGAVCQAYTQPVPPNVKLLGFVEAAQKDDLLWRCGAAINPLRHGAGTNLKMLDYMGHAAPVVSTPVGARGLDIEPGVQARISELDGFAAALREVLDDAEAASALGARGAQFADERYTWAGIAKSTVASIQQVLAAPAGGSGRKRILAVCDYEVHQAAGGGQVRIKELLSEAGREFDVTLLCFNNGDAEIRRAIAPGVLQRSVPKTAEHRREDIQSLKGQSVSVADLVAAKHCLDNSAMVAAFREEIATAAVVSFEQCFLAPLLGLVPEGMPIVHSSQNVEIELKRELLAARNDGDRWIELTERLEREIAERADLVLCVSDSDTLRFRERYGLSNVLTVENGVRMPQVHRAGLRPLPEGARTQPPLAVFVGSAHPPNARAAQFIIDELAARNPQVNFALVGSVCEAINVAALPPNVALLGFLSQSDKEALFAIADIAVNPLFEGGGSSLKVPDFLAAGLPLLSSAVGARGFPGLQAGTHYIETNPEAMGDWIPKLCGDAELSARLSAEATDYVASHLDWRILGGRMRRELRRLIGRDGPCRVLVLTYRFGEPARGGAETFLLNVLRELDKSEELQIDVAAPAVGAIHDRLHFSADYEPPSAHDGVPALRGQVRLFPADPPPQDRFEDAAVLQTAWMKESLLIGADLAQELGVGLLGGWNFPENSDGRIVRWAGRIAQVKLPAGIESVRVAGLALQPVQVSMRVGGAESAAKSLSGKFSFQQALPAAGELLELRASAVMDSSEDARELAYIVSSIELTGPAGSVEIDLRQGMEERARANLPERWVAKLIEVVKRRPRDIDRRFCRIRGPHSHAMERWLDQNAANYDVILAQGVPFASSVLGVRTGAVNGLATVVLPHFHMEDRYYHWRDFYDAFARADAVIAAPAASKTAFFDRVCERSVALPGGGLTTEDFSAESIARGREAFRRLHRGERPFVLVLGRKTGAKHYRMIVQACEKLRRAGHDLDVVLIGPDDDGLPLQGAGVHYYGAQPREVVIGALADSLCLANLSESESFGIVLLESWMAKRPVIARSSTVAFTELVRDGENGYLADNLDDVAAAIERYLGDRALADRHGTAGIDTAQGYSWAALADHLRQIILGVASERNRGVARKGDSSASQQGGTRP
ncbi:glycosyltransferase family 4 protein [Lysobacter sp. TAB13]|uniref:glycosyltransferase family 4 protein n=1 Tax=Lysobacter sp. TAB13 TaxID=3233065 RepID=UPI003F9B3AD6